MGSGALKIDNGAARLEGELTFSTVKALYGEILEAAEAGKLPGSVDLAGVSQIDSAGLTLLLEWQSIYRQNAGSDKLMEVHNPPEALMKIARLCDAEDYIGSSRQVQGADLPS